MAAPFIWGEGGTQMTPEQIAAQEKIAQAMMLRGSDYSPVQHWTQGLARVAEAVTGGMRARGAYEASQSNMDWNRKAVADAVAAMNGGGAPVAAPTAQAPAADPAAAIAGIESGGKYDALGPVANASGDRAYGKYQVMGANIPQWTQAHLGKQLTPEQFLADPAAQDAVFRGQFGQYQNKYGPEGAARAWFAGEGGMNNPNAKDVLGTTVRQYGQKFAQAAGPQAALTTGQPVAPPVAAPAAAPGINPAMINAISDPRSSEATQRIMSMLLQQQQASAKVQTVDAGNKILVIDARGNVVRELQKGEPNKGPEMRVIGKDAFGNEIYGEYNPNKPEGQRVSPYSANPAAAAAAPTITGPDGKSITVQPGQNAKVIQEAVSKAGAAAALPATFEDTSKLRHEFTQLPAYKNIAQAAPIYQSMHDAAGRNTKAADLNMVYGLGKIMDPGSVVREGEIQMANNAQGWQEKLNGIIGQINNEGGLTPAGRKALMAEAYSRIQSYKQEFDRDATRYKGISERNRINHADVVPDFGEFRPWEIPAATPSAAAAAAAMPTATAPVVINGYTIKAK